MHQLDPQTIADFRQTLGNFATGITIITCLGPKGPVGITVNSFTSVSLEPPLILFCLGKSSKSYAAVSTAQYFNVNILSEEQESLSRHFSGAQAADWSEITCLKGPDDKPPLLAGCLAWLQCRRESVYQGGDHDILLGRVEALGQRRGAKPLLYFHGRYRSLEDPS
jgi:flavin reductase (DIM6/NTAB) family NADH-FMN oxidoreductase RutF